MPSPEFFERTAAAAGAARTVGRGIRMGCIPAIVAVGAILAANAVNYNEKHPLFTTTPTVTATSSESGAPPPVKIPAQTAQPRVERTPTPVPSRAPTSQNGKEGQPAPACVTTVAALSTQQGLEGALTKGECKITGGVKVSLASAPSWINSEAGYLITSSADKGRQNPQAIKAVGDSRKINSGTFNELTGHVVKRTEKSTTGYVTVYDFYIDTEI